MEFNLICESAIEFVGGPSGKLRNQPPPPPKKKKLVSKKRAHSCSYPLTLNPVLDKSGSTAGDKDGVGSKSFRAISIELLFGNTELAKQFKDETFGRLTSHLTLSSSNTGRLMITTKGKTPTPKDDDDVDIFEALLKLGEDLPPNSLQFTLNLKDFEYANSDINSASSYDDEFEMNFIKKGLKLKRNESGSASLEGTDIQLPSENWFFLWMHSRATMFYGLLSVNVQLDVAAVAELYKRRFGRGPLPTQLLGVAPDMVIFVGGSKDKDKAIKCHKSILSETSPVFAAMFRTDMLEAKEGTLEIVDFSEDCLRALIEFIYRGNMEAALNSSEMTFELLQLADKYVMKTLMDMLLHLIWSMPCSWFSADVAVRLYFFAKNAGKDLAQAEEKYWEVLKWFARKHPQKLIESNESLRLCENPRAVMELIVLLFKMIKTRRKH